jgi:hypothetical protein
MNRGGHGYHSPAAVIAIVHHRAAAGSRFTIHRKVMRTQEFQPVTLGAPGTLYTVPPLTHSPNHPIG